MKFTISINQKAAIDSGLELDIIDLAIFDFLYTFSHSPACKKFYCGNSSYYLFSWKLIVQQLPILALNTRQAVYNRMKKLEAAKLIVPDVNNQTNNASYYKFGENYDLLLFVYTVPTAKGEPVNESSEVPANGHVHNNSIKNTDNTIKDNKSANEKSITERKTEFADRLCTWDNEHKNKYPKLMYSAFFKYWVEQSQKKKKTVLRFEVQEFFDMGRRLSTWFGNCGDQDIFAQWQNDVKLPELKNLLTKLING